MAGDALYEQVGILGTGLIGGSLGLALRKEGAAGRVIGYDADSAMLAQALQRGAIAKAAGSVGEVAAESELVFIAVPVRAIPAVLAQVAPALRSGTTLSDVGSVKEHVVDEAARILPPACHFIGGHPLAGSEQRGVGFADPHLFRDAYYVLTPSTACNTEAYSRLHALLTSLGARVIAMDPRQHDRAVSVISHLPHIMAMSLMNLALQRAEEYPLLRLAAGGFRDMTRIAASDAGLWLDILMENREAVEESLEECIAAMQRIGGLLAEGEEAELTRWMESASSGRQSLAPVLGESLAGYYSIILAVDDRPGVISDVTLTVGEMGINIEDLELVHPLESGRGLLRLTISGEEAASHATEALRSKGYRANLSKTLGDE
ncbi:MAG: prephenate dehydrogenase [Actinobacteria bacterium]|jgi:prephenate dehydrogenase|nr:MAG: prephenate dehydrogenase [Actinomycetota bacterium]